MKIHSNSGLAVRTASFATCLPILSLAAAAALFAAGCATTPSVDEGATTSSTAELSESEAMLLTSGNVAMLWVNGMGCPLCANNVERQLNQLGGVERVTVNLGTGLITAHLTPDARPTREQLERAVTNSGFTLVRAEVSQ